MKLMQYSLRFRLLILILLPLIIVSVAAVFWRFSVAKATAENIFDRNLTMLSFAVSRDIALSEGDSLTAATSNLFKETSGTDVFYNAYGPDGSFVSGYSSPPLAPQISEDAEGRPYLFTSTHLGIPIRAARLSQITTIDGITGSFVVTVWQKLDQRTAFARDLASRAAMVAALLVTTVAGLVFFGIRLGLRPLAELENAIQKRLQSDLSPIVRQVPSETMGIVSRLNTLFKQVTEARKIRERLISNAAHQLRNPIAAIHSMAQATSNAKTLEEAKERSATLLQETRHATRMTEQLLSLEKVEGQTRELGPVDFTQLIRETSQKAASAPLAQGVDFSLDVPSHPVWIKGDSLLLAEAYQNLVDNALAHGGEKLTEIKVKLSEANGKALLDVANDGQEIPRPKQKTIFERFSQGNESKGTGLGLAIVNEIMLLHNGSVRVDTEEEVIFSMTLPKV